MLLNAGGLVKYLTETLLILSKLNFGWGLLRTG